MLTYSFDTCGDEYLYVHLYRCIRNDIETGVIAAGQRLPSKRALAKHLGVSVITVEGAYAQLQAEGYVSSVPRRGYYANRLERPQHALPGAPWSARPGAAQESPGMTTRLHASSAPLAHPTRLAYNPAAEKPPLVADFTGASPGTGVFPYGLWARTVREVLTCESEESLLSQTAPAGSPRLRAALASYLAGSRGMAVDPDQIVVGAGAQTLYGLIVQLLGRDRCYAVEDPGYPRLTKIYQANDVALRHIPLDGAGLLVEDLDASVASVVHVMPSHQYPTGLVTSVGRRYELLAWASDRSGRTADRYIVEDDYDCEFRMAGRPIPALQSIDATGRVIYANTFAKSLGPAFKVGYMVLPPELSVRFAERLGFYACTVSVVEQLALARFIETGDYERHVSRSRVHLRTVRDELLQILRRSSLADCLTIEGADAGLHFMMGVHVQTPDDDRALAEKARARGVALAPLSTFSTTGATGPLAKDLRWFMMSYAGVDPAAIPAAVAVLEQVLAV